MSKKDSKKCDCTLEGRTINLAKEGNSMEDRRTKLLVYEKKYPTQPFCGAQIPIGVRSTPKSARKIRVCTIEDIAKTCPPVLCDCPPQKPPLTLWGAIKRCISFSTRSAIVAGVIYWTWSNGVWGDANKTEKLYIDIKKSLCGKDSVDSSPRMDLFMHKGREKWNGLVSKSFQLITALSDNIGAMVKSNEECPKDSINTTEKIENGQ